MPAAGREGINNWHVGQTSLLSLASCRVGAEKAMAPHSSTLAWKIPGTEETGGLPSMGSHRVRHDWRDLAAAAGLEQMVYVVPWHPGGRIDMIEKRQ